MTHNGYLPHLRCFTHVIYNWFAFRRDGLLFSPCSVNWSLLRLYCPVEERHGGIAPAKVWKIPRKLQHTPRTHPGQSFHRLLVKVAWGVFQRCVETTLERWSFMIFPCAEGSRKSIPRCHQVAQRALRWISSSPELRSTFMASWRSTKLTGNSGQCC